MCGFLISVRTTLGTAVISTSTPANTLRNMITMSGIFFTNRANNLLKAKPNLILQANVHIQTKPE